MLTHIAAVGIVYGAVSGVIYSVLNNYLHMSTTLVATATALVTFPRALRLFTGMLTDTCPIFGYRRRPYMIIGWSLSFISCLLMAALPLGEPYYTDPSLSNIATVDMTPEQLATLNTDAPNRGIKLIILMMLANFGTVMAYSGFNGALMDVSQREPEATRGTAMGDVIVVHYIVMVISSFRTGNGLNGEDWWHLLMDDGLQRHHVGVRRNVIPHYPFLVVLHPRGEGRARRDADPAILVQPLPGASDLSLCGLSLLLHSVFDHHRDCVQRDSK
ncbi:unnamed protein product [Phytophthora fragariaefolia]|uniref:Unnamed protein product n=1 Tax=Phytophthora fragariaefolia TaxID=1490495 RepID=A0A9W6XF79_9STRA|nr:unnamed protein product [Phytophthora fragariaefolia]